MPGRILALAWICLVVVMGGCAHGDFWASTPEEQFPDPTDPAYPVEALKARAERVRAVERWQTSLDALNRLIEFRRSARISRDRSGNVVSISDDSDLQHWRMEMETELLRAEGHYTVWSGRSRPTTRVNSLPGGPATMAKAPEEKHQPPVPTASASGGQGYDLALPGVEGCSSFRRNGKPLIPGRRPESW
jgi:hypothetical protein